MITKIVHCDLVGFIRNCFGADNGRRQLNIKWFTSSSLSSTIALSLDPEKAFDGGEWGYFFKDFNLYGFGPLAFEACA